MANKKDVYLIADNITSPLGVNTAQNFAQVKQKVSGIEIYNRPSLSAQPLAAALFTGNEDFMHGNTGCTKFEKLAIASITDALSQINLNVTDKRTGLILSSTKGNISLLETDARSADLQKRVVLTTSAAIIAGYFNFVNQPVIVSNACVSGVLALINGMRLIQSGVYDNVVVCGADVVNKFIVSGFQSFQALSTDKCKPFDKNRDGLNLGEAAGTIILSGNPSYYGKVRVTGGGVSNDANHISGPSRTGLELAFAINKAIEIAGIDAACIGNIAAHGTATVYNDDMEANAITLAGLATVPVTALKSYYGHTLGAAGLIESILLQKSIESQILLPTIGFAAPGAVPVNINIEVAEQEIKHGLKTASGFGGCNAALVLSK